MNILRLKSDSKGSIASLPPNTEFILVESAGIVVTGEKDAPAKFATVSRQVVSLEETLPLAPEPVSAKPQGE